jgi:hypothetical protein
MRAEVALSMLLFALSIPEAGQEGKAGTNNSYIERTKNTILLFCYGADNSTGSRLGRSEIVVSPNGQYRAYAEAMALFSGSGCKNYSKLFLAETGGDFGAILSLEPIGKIEGNGIRAVDWSHDSRFLLIEQQRWYYESEYGSPAIMLLDMQSMTFLAPDAPQLFERFFGKQCYVFLQAQGLSPENNIVLVVYPDDYELESSCVEERSLWILDPWKEALASLPNDYQVQQYGRLEEHKPEK